VTQCAPAIVGDQAILDRCARDLPLPILCPAASVKLIQVSAPVRRRTGRRTREPAVDRVTTGYTDGWTTARRVARSRPTGTPTTREPTTHARYSLQTAVCSASYIAANATLLAFAAECRAARDKVQRRASNSEESDLAGVRAQLNCGSLDCKR